MSKKVALSTLNATTLDILNVIRNNATLEYQSQIPVVKGEQDIRGVGQILVGAPALQNQFINALVNRIAFVVTQSATFNNPYKELKKGYIEYGETIEDIFVEIANAVEYSAEKGEQREFKITKPKVHSIFHIMNWRVLYPVTIQKNDLKRAFLSVDGVTDLIAKIVEQVYVGAEYDEFLLFKYLIIKGVTKGGAYPVSVGASATMKEYATAFRGMSNKLPFMSDKYNEASVKTTTPKERQVIFMDADFNAEFDVEVLASAFNMEKADFMGRLHLIDDFTSFDNERFEEIRANSDGLEEVTATELALMADVKAIICDENWFQVYDNENEFTEKYVTSGLYWNYFYHTWKTISYSPFANMVAFIAQATNTAKTPSSFDAVVDSVSKGDDTVVVTMKVDDSTPTTKSMGVKFKQSNTQTADGVAVNENGGIILPLNMLTASQLSANTFETTPIASIEEANYTASQAVDLMKAVVGDKITFNKDA